MIVTCVAAIWFDYFCQVLIDLRYNAVVETALPEGAYKHVLPSDDVPTTPVVCTCSCPFLLPAALLFCCGAHSLAAVRCRVSRW